MKITICTPFLCTNRLFINPFLVKLDKIKIKLEMEEYFVNQL